MKQRYFFALEGGAASSPDEIGSEFETLEAAYIDGCRAALEISMEMLWDRRDPNGLRFDITDADGLFLTELAFAEVLRPGAQARRPPAVAPALRRFRTQAADRRRIMAELTGTLALTTNTLAATREILVRSRRQSAQMSHAPVDKPLH